MNIPSVNTLLNPNFLATGDVFTSTQQGAEQFSENRVDFGPAAFVELSPEAQAFLSSDVTVTI